jgi:predicted dehydrogenase
MAIGAYLVRNFMTSAETRVTMVCDMSQPRLDKVASLYPGIGLTGTPDELISDMNVEAVVIAPPFTRISNSRLAALRAGKHVLVEKANRLHLRSGEALIDEADRRGLVLMVDHTFVYTARFARCTN